MYILAPGGWCFGGNSFGLTATQLSALVTQPGGLQELSYWVRYVSGGSPIFFLISQKDSFNILSTKNTVSSYNHSRSFGLFNNFSRNTIETFRCPEKSLILSDCQTLTAQLVTSSGIRICFVFFICSRIFTSSRLAELGHIKIINSLLFV